MEVSTLIRSVNQTGIETLYGGTLSPLPALTDAEQRTLSRARAIVRMDKVGFEAEVGQLWGFVLDDEVYLIRAESVSAAHNASTALADTTDLVAEIQQLVPIAWMPEQAYARALLTRRDAEDVYDQIAVDNTYSATLFLVSDGLTQEEAEVAFDALRTARVAARISFMRVRGTEVELTYGIWIGQDGDDIWMASVAPPQSDSFALETVLEGTFQQKLNEGVKSLGLSP